jgi:hypothetical protein
MQQHFRFWFIKLLLWHEWYHFADFIASKHIPSSSLLRANKKMCPTREWSVSGLLVWWRNNATRRRRGENGIELESKDKLLRPRRHHLLTGKFENFIIFPLRQRNPSLLFGHWRGKVHKTTIICPPERWSNENLNWIKFFHTSRVDTLNKICSDGRATRLCSSALHSEARRNFSISHSLVDGSMELRCGQNSQMNFRL